MLAFVNRHKTAVAVGLVAFAILVWVGSDAAMDDIDDPQNDVPAAPKAASRSYDSGYTAILTCKIVRVDYQVNYCLASHRGENSWDGGLVKIENGHNLQTLNEHNFPWSDTFAFKFQLSSHYRISIRANGDDHNMLRLSILDQSGSVVFKDEVTEYGTTYVEQ